MLTVAIQKKKDGRRYVVTRGRTGRKAGMDPYDPRYVAGMAYGAQCYACNRNLLRYDYIRANEDEYGNLVPLCRHCNRHLKEYGSMETLLLLRFWTTHDMAHAEHLADVLVQLYDRNWHHLFRLRTTSPPRGLVALRAASAAY